MAAYEDVLSWAKTRPSWQQKILVRLAVGEKITEQEYEEIARSLTEEPELPPSAGWFSQVEHPQFIQDEPVRILAVRNLENVNRLAPGQELTFDPDGLTVVFGNNGSGKSGYARVIRSMVRARHRSDILPDIFAKTSGVQTGELVYRVGANKHEAFLGQSTDPILNRVSFYDEDCGDAYLTAEADISYRPSAVQLLEDLVIVCKGVHQVIKDWEKEVSNPGILPEVSKGSSADNFLRSLDASTTDEAVADAITCPPDVDEQLLMQVDEVTRLRAMDPIKEKRRLNELAGAQTKIADHLENVDRAIGLDAQKHLDKLVEIATTAQNAAELISRRTFDDAPLSAVGTDVWKKLWYAAEQYSKVAYPEYNYPYTADGARCVLCQQALNAKAVNRFEKFQHFMLGVAAQEAENAQQKVIAFRSNINKLEVVTSSLASAMTILEHSDEFATGPLNLILEALQTRKSALLGGKELQSIDVASTIAELRQGATRYGQLANDVTAAGFADKLAAAEAQEQCLRDQIAMRDGYSLITEELSRLRKVAELKRKLSKTNHAAITKKVSELIRTYVTDEACDYFTNEAKSFGVEHVTFKATRARQGAQLHKPDFVDALPGSKLQDVLSEGEQTALGLAGFLTETHFDKSKSALIFDDPVSSLDHVNRELVAKRIVELAKDRQVIVFTHDVAFTMLLYKAVSEAQVPYCMRSVERKRKIGPGYTRLSHPWTAKDASQRVNTIRNEVATLRRKEKGMSEEEYLQETEKIAGHMSQTWERIISQVLVEPLIDYKSLEVRVGKLRVIGRVTEDDVKTYDDSYSCISRWASRHDPHPELNFSPPNIEQLNKQIEIIEKWLKKVKKYQS